MRVLFVATSDIHLYIFHKPYLNWLCEQGWSVDIAVENRGNKRFSDLTNIYYIEFPRTLLAFGIFKAYKTLKKIIDKGQYDLIHCHTPIPSMLARLASIDSRKNGTKVLYTAHGFHFFRGAPMMRWILYYPAEYLLSVFTDGIVTINREDFDLINQRMWHRDSFYIKGIGVDARRFVALTDEQRSALRLELGYSDNDFILLYIAEFIPRKNHEFLIKALPLLVKEVPNLKVILAGEGVLLNRVKSLSDQLELEQCTVFLGFRDDIHRWSAICDIGISCSKQEGLGLGLVEEMMCRVPVVATEDRGHREIVIDGENGFLCAQDDQACFINSILRLYRDPELRSRMGAKAYQKAQEFTINSSLESMITVYKKYLN